jgi:alkaline phosphatase D
MRNRIPLALRLLTLVLIWSWFVFDKAGAQEPQPWSRITFGSCAHQEKPQPIWDAIVAAQPDGFLFVGDNIYGDTEDMNVLKQKWDLLGAQPGYQKLMATCPILATWDDHDYGANDAGVEYPKKRESQQLFLDFFAVPADSPRRRREGIYDAVIVGPAGKRVQLILLDTRYFRSPLVKRNWLPEPGEGDTGPYGRNLDPAATMLGAAQWKWLEEQLQVPAEVRIIASSIQALPDGHHWEKWGNFPLERQRLFEVIRSSGATGVLFISGDRHSAEISAFDPGIGYPLVEVTSSGLNRPSIWHNEPNVHRIGTKYVQENFGMILIDWTSDDPIIRCQVRDLTGKVVLQHSGRLTSMRP